jgi:hypothetical protein
MLARQMTRSYKTIEYDVVGENAKNATKLNGQMYKGPEWFTSSANDNDIYLGIYNN